jgi:hypothetical protein
VGKGPTHAKRGPATPEMGRSAGLPGGRREINLVFLDKFFAKAQIFSA